MSKLSHLDARGNARMVDVSGKPDSLRVARAEAFVQMSAETLALIKSGGHKKGDVLTVARIAGIQAAKRCADLIPLCHPLLLTGIDVDIAPDEQGKGVRIETTCKVNGSTGVEMEALAAATVAALTIYDMCKAVDRGMVITDVRLLEKSVAAAVTSRQAHNMLQLRYFASLREMLGTSEEKIRLPDDIETIAALTGWLRQRGAPWDDALARQGLLVALNQEMASDRAAIHDGDEIAWFPPVTGG